MVQRAILQRIDMCCSAVMTAIAHDTAEGVVVMIAGDAADDLRWSCRWCSRMISVKLQVDSNDDIQRIDVCSCVVAAGANGTAEGSVAMAADGDG